MSDQKLCQKCNTEPVSTTHRLAKYCESCKVDVKLERRTARLKARKAARAAAKATA